MFRRTLILAVVTLALVGETAYFLRRAASGVLWTLAQRDFYHNHHAEARRLYERALRLGGDRAEIETDFVELVLFGLDQVEAGVKIEMPFTPTEALRIGHGLTEKLILQAPYRAYYWSLASELAIAEAALIRRSVPLDLSMLSEDPLDNLMPQEWLGMAMLEQAGRLEPSVFIYQDLIAETWLEKGVPNRAAVACRRSVRACPILDDHRYLLRHDLPTPVLEGAVAGFKEAAAGINLVPKSRILYATARFLTGHGQDERARPFFEASLRLEPQNYDARLHLGLTEFRLQEFDTAIADLNKAIELKQDSPWPRYYLGLIDLKKGNPQAALAQLRAAKERSPKVMRFGQELARVLESVGDFQEAERQFSAVAHVNPDDPAGWSALLAFHVRQQQFSSAREDCAHLLELRSEDRAYRAQCETITSGLP
jgi:tetratricopeptide (TPR) repeat protein